MSFLKSKKSHIDIYDLVSQAAGFADIFNYTDPENTTYRLRHALTKLGPADQLDKIPLYAELTHRSAMLPSKLRKPILSASDYHDWLTNNLENLGSTRRLIKESLRQPWRECYDWLGQSLAHSSILQNCHARHAYEQLAINYRLQHHLLNLNDSHSLNPGTTKNGYIIESVFPTSHHIQAKATRLIQHYYSPTIES